jgi:hypothetical protein
MKRIAWLAWIPFFLISCTPQAMQKMNENYTHNALLPIESHDITVTFHPGTKLLLVQDNMQINREKCKEFFTGAFILNKSVYLSSIKIEGSNDVVREITTFGSDYFNNELTEEQWNRIDQLGAVYEIQMGPYEQGHDLISVSIKYQVQVDDKTQGVRMTDDTLEMDGNSFWYPTFFRDQVPFSIKVVAPQRYNVDIPGYTGTVAPLETLLKETSFWIPVASDPITINAND